MKLIEKQMIFARNIAKLIIFITDEARHQMPQNISTNWKIEVRLAEGYVGDSINKPSEDTPHLRYGTHFLRLGQDLIVHLNDVMIETVIVGTPQSILYEIIMNFWESLHPLNRAGGRWKKRDYAHFSMEHNGVA